MSLISSISFLKFSSVRILFFLVCASVEPEDGRPQIIPSSEKSEEQSNAQSIEVGLTPSTVTIDGIPYQQEQFKEKIAQLLIQKDTDSERIVIVKSQSDVPYKHWIAMTEIVQKSGGIVTLLLEEEQTIIVE